MVDMGISVEAAGFMAELVASEDIVASEAQALVEIMVSTPAYMDDRGSL